LNGGFITTEGSRGLRRMMDVIDLRQRYLSNNVANMKTPGFQAQDVDFIGLLRDARQGDFLYPGLEATHQDHYPAQSLRDDEAFHLDGQFLRLHLRNVRRSEEEEMISQTVNSLTYRAASDLLARKYRMISTAITGGK